MLEDINSVITVNLVAPLYLSRALMRHWLDLPASVHSESTGQSKRDTKVNLNKRILMISSISGLVNMTPQRQVAYNASKGGLTMAAKVRLIRIPARHKDVLSSKMRAGGLQVVWLYDDWELMGIVIGG